MRRRTGLRTTQPQDRDMKTKAAIAWKAGQPLTIEEVELGGPREGEVLVEIKATGICHTDYYTLSGADPEGLFPAILGHEGAGVVVDVGPGVTTLKKDDHVIPLYTPECRQCKFCLSQKTNLCQAIRSTQGRGADRLAEIGFVRQAEFALAAFRRVQGDNVVILFQGRHARPHVDHHARAFMAQDGREQPFGVG